MTARRFETSWGALPEGDAVRFRLWAPGEPTLTLHLAGRDVPMTRSEDGWFEARVPATPGEGYHFVLPEGSNVPDPAARAQMEGVHGSSRVVDPAAYDWTVPSPLRPWEEAVIYEIHVGTFTEEGTFAAAAERMAYLAEIGVTAVELMPVAQFDGDRGWGYDGVLLYAPHPSYGTPEDMKRLVETAHAAGLMVLLDVVYNHFGPEGNYLSTYAPDFYSERHTPWGNAIDFTEDAVRRFFIENALYWLEEFDLDGLRFDAVDHLDDRSETDILVEMAQRIREVRGDRPTWLTTEDNRNVTHLHVRAPDGSPRLYDGEWNDDLHNAVHVVATGETEGYYVEFADDPWGHYARALAEGFAYQGETSPGTGEARGEPSTHLPPSAFVDFLQNHDQIGNRALGERLITLTPPPMLDALQAIHLLSPHIPLMFMGEEYDETEPFFFFTDFHGELAATVREGRRDEFSHFRMFVDAHDREAIPDPNEVETFLGSKLDWSKLEEEDAQAALARTRMLLKLRQEHVVPRVMSAGGDAGRIVEVEPGADRDRLAPRWGAVAASRQPGRRAARRAVRDRRDRLRARSGGRRRVAVLRRGVLPRRGPERGPRSRRGRVSLRALARANGIATRYGERAVPDETLRAILSRLGAEGEGAACHLPGWLGEAPTWGVFCQLYELRPAAGRSDWGIGDLRDLADLARVLGAAGADFLGINPLHALFLGNPAHCSPFSPSDRRFLNPLCIAPDDLPGAASAAITEPAPDGDLHRLSGGGRAEAARAAGDLRPRAVRRGSLVRGGLRGLRRRGRRGAAAPRPVRGAVAPYGRRGPRRGLARLARALPPCGLARGGGVRPGGRGRPTVPPLAPMGGLGAARRRRARRARGGDADRALSRPRRGRGARRRGGLGLRPHHGRAHRRRAPRRVLRRGAGLGARGAEPADPRPRPNAVPSDDRGTDTACGRPQDRPRDGAAPALPHP